MFFLKLCCFPCYIYKIKHSLFSFFFLQARRDREEQEKMKAQESLKSAQHNNKHAHQDHSIVSQNSGGNGHLHHSVVQNDLKLGLGGMGVGVGSNLGMMNSLDKSNQDLLKAVSKVNS